MSKPITFRYVPATGDPSNSTFRPSHWVHPESGVELHRGIDDGGIEWQVWTTRMGKPLACGAATLSDAKAMARVVLTDHKEWLA